MAQTPTGTSDPKRIQHFCRILEHCVSECADTRCGPHDVFLWNARRLSEAILYALAEGTELFRNTKNPAPDLKDLPKKLVEAGQLPTHMQGFFDTLRVCGNVGAHTQGPEVLADDETIDSCKTAIVHVVEWFYRRSKLARTMPEKLATDLVELESDQPKDTRQERHERDLRQLQTSLSQANGKVAYLQNRLAEVTSALTTGPNETPTVTEVVAMARSGQSLPRKALLVAAGGALGAAIAWAALHSQPAAAPAPAALAAVATPTCPPAPACAAAPACPACEAAAPATPEAPPAAAAGSAPAAAEPAVAASPTPAEPESSAAVAEVPPCPDGALLVEAGELKFAIGPSPRPEWSQPRPRPPRAKVAAFCIASDAVSGQAYAGAAHSPDCEPSKGNAALRGAGHLPVNQTSRACARAYCESQGGGLPTIAQWEMAVRSSKRPRMSDGTWEFAADSFPFEVFGDLPMPKGIAVYGYHKGPLGSRPRRDRPFLSWNKDSTVAAGHVAVSFRCTWPPKTSAATP